MRPQNTKTQGRMLDCRTVIGKHCSAERGNYAKFVRWQQKLEEIGIHDANLEPSKLMDLRFARNFIQDWEGAYSVKHDPIIVWL